MKIYSIKALWRSTSKTLIIRARNPQSALDKARRLKECDGVIDFEFIGECPPEWRIKAI